MATSRFVQITDKEINEIKINSILKNTKDPTKFGVKLFISTVAKLGKKSRSCPSAEGARFLEGSGGMLPRENFKNWTPEMAFPGI